MGRKQYDVKMFLAHGRMKQSLSSHRLS